MYNKLLKELRLAYKDCDFKIVKNGEELEIIYNDEKLQDDEKLIDNILDICEKHVKEDQMWNIVVTFDYFNEIIPIKASAKVSNKFENINSKIITSKSRLLPMYEKTFGNNINCNVSIEHDNSKISIFKKISTKIYNTIFEEDKSSQYISSECNSNILIKKRAIF